MPTLHWLTRDKDLQTASSVRAMPQFLRTPAPTSCPWGDIKCAAEIAPGWWSVIAARHGGFVLSVERLAAIPLEHLSASLGGQGLFGYFEEDCDWSIVAVAFPEEWRTFVIDRLHEPDLVDVAPRMFEAWVVPRMGGAGTGALCAP
jgi:hypothetical protein